MANKLSNKHGSSTESPMEHALLSSGRLRKKRLKACCKPSYHVRKLRNKGAIVVFTGNLLVITFTLPINVSNTVFHNMGYHSQYVWVVN